VRPTALVVGAVGVLGRAEGDEDDELLLDVVEAVFDVGAHEHGRSGPDGVVHPANPDRAPARNHVVDLVLGMRALGIGATGREHVQSDRQVVGPDEFVVQAAGLGARPKQVVEGEGVHGTRD
jgi:hypothetical protein